MPIAERAGIVTATARSRMDYSQPMAEKGLLPMKDVTFQPNRVMAPHKNRLKELMAACKKKKLSMWSCKKTTASGDLFLLYFGKPAHKIVAVGIAVGQVTEEVNPGWDWTNNPKGWFCDFRPLVKLQKPILMSDIKSHPVLGKWWKGFPYRGSGKTIKEPYRSTLLSLMASQNPRQTSLFRRYGNVKVKLTQGPQPPTKKPGQGISGTVEDRNLIEKRAMKVAISNYRSRGFKVEDCSDAKPYDLRCKKGSKTLYVEVKGSTGNGEEILLTPNEVKFARAHGKGMECFVLHSITIEGKGSQRKAKGGRKKIKHPWIIDEICLIPTGYSYRFTGLIKAPHQRWNGA